MTNKVQEVLRTARKFNSKEIANSYSNRTVKTTLVVEGKDGLFYVATGREYSILKKEGFVK